MRARTFTISTRRTRDGRPQREAHPAKCPAPVRGDSGRPATVVPDAGHALVELASASFPADRKDGCHEVPLLQRGVHAQASVTDVATTKCEFNTCSRSVNSRRSRIGYEAHDAPCGTHA